MTDATRRGFLKTTPFLAGLAPDVARAAQATPALPDPADPKYWDKVRSQFLLAKDKTFFNNGTIGAMPKVVVDRVVNHLYKMATDLADWDYHGDDWIAGYQASTNIRAKAAKLLNCDVKEMALAENVTAGISYVADGLDLKAGDEVLTTDQEHPGGRGAWLTAAKRRGIVFREIAIPKPAASPEQVLEIVRGAITPQTRVISISHVISGSGAILPAKQICAEARSRGIFTLLDGAQAAGHIAVDVHDLGCDAYAGCFHKWLLAPAGTGFLYVKQDKASDVWSTLASAQWDNHTDEGYRLSQRGTGSLSLLMGLDAALDFHLALGPARVCERIKYLGDRLREGLRATPGVKIFSPSDNAMCAGITVYNVAGYTGPKLQDEMWSRGRLRPRSSGEQFGVRHSTHIFNSPQEIDRAVKVVRDLARGQSA